MNGAPTEQVADLRAEAIARLNAYREKPNANDPALVLLQMEADQRYAIIIDIKRSDSMFMKMIQQMAVDRGLLLITM